MKRIGVFGRAKARRCFRSGIHGFGTTRILPTLNPLPCRLSRGLEFSRRSYLQHTPTLRRFNHLALRTGKAPDNDSGSHRASQISNALLLVGHVARKPPAFTSLPYVSPFRAVIVTATPFQEMRFQGVEPTSSPLPTSKDPSRFGTVSDRNNWQAVSAAFASFPPLMVELFAVALLTRTPGADFHPVEPLASLELPTPARVERALPYGKTTNPSGGFTPTLRTAAQISFEIGSVSVAQGPLGVTRTRIG